VTVAADLAALWGIGRDRVRGGWSRHVFTREDAELRAWFVDRATGLGLDVTTDRNGNSWAWWGAPGSDAVVCGSHLDSVPGGGQYDGPLGVASALAAVERLKARDVRPRRPFAVAVFAEEEGSRFGAACLGSRLLTGAIAPERALALTDGDGTTFAEAATGASVDRRHIGRDQEALARIGLFLELHVEQGRALVDLDAAVGVASAIDAHGRWRLRFEGQANHAGTTRMADRHDPMVAAARFVLAAQEIARKRHGVRATVGRIEPVPGGTNVVASSATAWLDVRAGEDRETRTAVDEILRRASECAAAEGCAVATTEESWSSRVAFDPLLAKQFSHALGDAPLLPTGAGHDAGVLAAAGVPTAMLFVRNPTGVSHSPDEHAEDADCERGVDALVTCLTEALS